MTSTPTQQRLKLMPRDSFTALSLHEKNAYLQTLANDFAAQTGREVVELDKDALSRLRRYYARRVFADLKLQDAPKDSLNDTLRRLGSAIRDNELQKDIAGGLSDALPARKVMRSPPSDDAQLMFFVPSIYDAPIKDDVNLMDVAPFSLSKQIRHGEIKYELKDCLITIAGTTTYGLATVFDYDIFLNMVSYLTEEMRRYKSALAKGLRPDLPPKTYRPNAAHILKFCRRSDGGKSYIDLENALDRLKATTIKIVNLSGGKRRDIKGHRSLIEDYRTITKTDSGRIDLVEIDIPNWVYDSVVRADKTLPLLTLHGDYFLISSGLGRFLYRLARKSAGKTVSRYSVKELHKRSGSTQDFRFFLRDLKEFISRTQAFPMPEYDLNLIEGVEGLLVQMVRRPESESKSLPQA